MPTKQSLLIQAGYSGYLVGSAMVLRGKLDR